MLLLAASLSASEQEMPSDVRLELTTLAWQHPIKGLYYINGGEVQELKAYSGGFSMPIDYQGVPIIRFYTNKESLTLPPEERPLPNGIAKLDPTMKHSLMIFLPKSKEQFEILIHDFSQESFPTNSCRIFNYSGLDIVFALGDQPIIQAIAPNETVVIKQDELADQNKMVKVQLAQQGKEAARVVYRSTWRFDNQSRASVFVLPAPNDQSSVQMRKFVERGLRFEASKTVQSL
ncbi:hypothetical protein SH580_15850 [Coraliomargarita algicola]|uniref:DUF3108 domain-containing protein n=1 Tax=Coraliomargarita algicola TaxID=3092156 RepID=A0ABZ0RFF1_9BACT|nr:hypothetical protein [Coraliomargarita sp. J2-16]WPJ94904.1 hypothetical protein SH580_15850 [Coraliomargarita sp. J2-16]